MTKIVMGMDELRKRVDARLLTAMKHPFLDLFIYNYTKRTQYRKLWDLYTERCRGLIIDGNGNILNNPFPKFFNIGEREDLMIQNLPLEMPKITEKLDGKLGILYEEADNVAICTRGRFDSPYALWATNWLRSKGFGIGDFKSDYTYLFEIIYPESKNIVNYRSRSELVLLAVRNNDWNREGFDFELDYVKEAQELGLSYAKEYTFGGVHDAVKYLERRRGTEAEGFVCKYSNGLRIKIKSSDYFRLSKILTGISTKDIWESLRDTGSVEQIVDTVPDEFFKWVKNVEMELRVSQLKIMKDALDITVGANKLNSRIEQAEYIYKHTEDRLEIRGIVFFLLSGRIEKAKFAAWQRVKPAGELFNNNVVEEEM